jgi:hypothetical protein
LPCNIGPFDLDELKIQGIKKDTQIWHEGMQDWSTAGEIEELKNLFPVVPPPIIKKTEIKPPPVAVKKNTHWFSRLPKIIGYIIIALIAVVIITNYVNERNNLPSYEESVMTIAEMEAADPINYLNADGKYHPNLIGDKLKINGVVHNKATVTTYKDVVIDVIFYSKTNTEIAREQYTIYDFFDPNTQKEFKLKVNNYSNVESIGWEVANAVAK